MSGKDVVYTRDKAIQSAALTDEQQKMLEARGVLSPDEIHKLASKTKKVVDAEVGKGLCHSDFVDPDAAKRIQKDRLVQVRVKDATTPAE